MTRCVTAAPVPPLLGPELAVIAGAASSAPQLSLAFQDATQNRFNSSKTLHSGVDVLVH